jgi:hypothetical protein
MQRNGQRFSPTLALMALAITFSLAVCAQAQTVDFLTKFNGNNGSEPFGPVVRRPTEISTVPLPMAGMETGTSTE